MQFSHSLDNIYEYIYILRDSIKDRQVWEPFNYEYTFRTIKDTQCMLKQEYFRTTHQRFEESFRQLFEGVFTGDLNILINYLNGFLYLEKLNQKVRWHQNYGSFPQE